MSNNSRKLKRNGTNLETPTSVVKDISNVKIGTKAIKVSIVKLEKLTFDYFFSFLHVKELISNIEMVCWIFCKLSN